MMDHSENTLRAAIKCLQETVTPAVDPDEPQANEQLRLTIDFLEFLRTRLYDLHARHRYELGHQIEVARALTGDAKLVSDRAAAELDSALLAAVAALDDAGIHTDGLRTASQWLWCSVRGLVREARQAPDEVRERIGLAVVQGIEPLVEMESAWYLPFEFEPDPASVPALDDLLLRTPGTAS
ncbi:hypothetical protein [Streptomyces sp. NPDC058424]|uniref:hypothetical protein n=1 Tax=Streptomyces sp. NPDC058424 TaxID=3346491 RepID=UPI0036625938